MSNDYRPGTVAKATVDGEREIRVARYDGGWARLDDPYCYYSDDLPPGFVTHVRPLVVLDLGTDPAMYVRELLAGGDHAAHVANARDLLPDLARQIEAQTKPPRIPEPGLWGVVEATYAKDDYYLTRKWVRYGTGWRDAFGHSAAWSDLIDPVLVREGIDS